MLSKTTHSIADHLVSDSDLDQSTTANGKTTEKIGNESKENQQRHFSRHAGDQTKILKSVVKKKTP